MLRYGFLEISEVVFRGSGLLGRVTSKPDGLITCF